MLIFLFLDSADHSTYTTLNWGAGGIRQLTLDANKIEQVLQSQLLLLPIVVFRYAIK